MGAVGVFHHYRGINQQDTDMKWITTVIMASAPFSLILLYNQKTKSSIKQTKLNQPQAHTQTKQNKSHQSCGFLNPYGMFPGCIFQDRKYLKGLTTDLIGTIFCCAS